MKPKMQVINCCPEMGMSLQPADATMRKMVREFPSMYRLVQVPAEVLKRYEDASVAMAAASKELETVWNANDPKSLTA